MKRSLYTLCLGLGLSMAIFAAVQRAEAVLGESADSVDSDRKVLSAVRGATTVRDGYTVHEVSSGATTVREYVSPAGTVFAVAWNGLAHPDLTLLLGAYAGEYENALQQTPRKRGQRTLRVQANRVVVEKWGHIRNLQGRAYAPDLIPPGVSIDAIK
jgi:hypothetical protein